MKMSSPKRNPLIVLSALCFSFASVLTLGACNKNSPDRLESSRSKWIDNPSKGEKDGGKIVFEDLGVSFEKPEVAYVYRDCGEATHSPSGPDNKWIPIIECYGRSGSGDGGDEDEGFGDDYDEDDDLGESSDDFAGYAGSDNVLRFFAAHKKGSINERAVETYRARYQNEGYVVDDINYYDDYLTKPQRRGIGMTLHVMNSETGYPETEIKRFIFPRGKVLFIVEASYPFGKDRGGIDGDWKRIFWNFEFAEDLAEQAEIDASEEMEENPPQG